MRGIRKYPNITNIKCSNCGVEFKPKHISQVDRFVNGELVYCSNKCSVTHKDNHTKRLSTIKSIYGKVNMFNYDKIKSTCIERYGVDNVSKLNHIKIKKLNTLHRNGYGSSFENGLERARFTCLNKYGVKFPFQNESIRNVALNNINYNGNNSGSCSMEEMTIYYCLRTKYNVIPQHKSEDYPFICDFYIVDLDCYVEYNGYYRHKSDPDTINRDNIKRQFAIDNNLNWLEFDDMDKLLHHFGCNKNITFPWEKSFNKSIKYKLRASDLIIKDVPKSECNKFLMDNHYQGKCNGQSIRYGLYKNNELLMIMTFGKPRYNKNYQYELLRLCTRQEYIIYGGANKLFKYFLHNNEVRNVISYCDKSKFSGNVYEQLGFVKLGKPNHGIHWIKDNKRISNNQLLRLGFNNLVGKKIGVIYNKGTSNEQLMIQHGWVPFKDLGQQSYVYLINT